MFLPNDYDPHGRLKLPVFFWLVLLLQARTWVLFVAAGASREQGEALLRLFYPDSEMFWLGLLPGIPAVLAFLLSGRRGRWPGLWMAWRWVLIAAQCGLLVWQVALVMSEAALSGITLSLMVLDVVALVWLLTNPRLKACFSPSEE
ncbi:DUF2919 domain-containing protein [Atlantibacter subterranea]|uniref:DUF2919 domain-containing protein n=1 Tax=Atlantibacter subterraneus TaxID=255519 RepID=A0A3R9EYI0_9ENTR|nr:DUF2919 domain-containing protein [Atlantibacter subterranea]MDA3132674.1 DUF2919 domain-containing protein [Atlantibacter subterranea]RSB58877.1 DUF2919 domain-containing protein [Atlantibacter subterranea]RSE04815.1 DUF2919 domain-containing protein [Atlantibacter subterranea]RSE21991.1 DUF2919 domain-containing protein [Atlantibacter subterranea]